MKASSNVAVFFVLALPLAANAAALALPLAANAACDGPATEGALLDHLIGVDSGYDRATRPSLAKLAVEGRSPGSLAPPERVEIQLQVESVHNVDTKNGQVTVNFLLRVVWFDSRLLFNNSETGGCWGLREWVGYTSDTVDRLWTPDVYVENTIRASHIREAVLELLPPTAPSATLAPRHSRPIPSDRSGCATTGVFGSP